MIVLQSILEKGFLRRIHKEIRSQAWANHFPQALLVKDPTLLSDFQYELDDALRLLKNDVLRGDYRPQAATIVKAAKGAGLRRPLALLQHGDAILLSALTQAARTGIVQIMHPWVNFGRADDAGQAKRDKAVSLGLLEPESSSWFLEWMRYRGLLKVVADDPREWLVVSDVADFFPRLDLEILRDSFVRKGFLDDTATNLLFYILDQLLERVQYGPRSRLGLPQDPYDASRILAHLYLLPLDEELMHEGRNQRYTRWVDDIAVSVADELEGAQVIGRVQDALRKVGLSPNSQKTRTITKQRFREEHLEEYNGVLDVAHRRTKMGTVDDRFRRTFDEWLRRFLAREHVGRWERVLRRFYTESRRMRNRRLAGRAFADLEELPQQGAYILDYLCFGPAAENGAIAQRILRLLGGKGQLYEDIQILCYEWLLAAPFLNDPILRAAVTHTAYRHLLGVGEFARPTGYVRGLIAFVVLKFGGVRALPRLCRMLKDEAELDSAFTLNALYVLSADASTRARAWTAVEHLRLPEVGRLRRFLDAIDAGDLKAVGIALGLVSVAKTELPHRALFRARALPMLYILRNTPAATLRLATIQKQNAKKIGVQEEQGLRDFVMESHF